MTGLPRKRHLIHLHRELAEVNPGLRAKMGMLARGKLAWPLYLHGPPGSGKTRAALCLLDRIPDSWYTDPERMADAIMGGREENVRRIMLGHQLVVVDEVGTRSKATDLHYRAIKFLADEREEKAVVWISNVAPGHIADCYDERIASRLLCGTVIGLFDGDRRVSRG